MDFDLPADTASRIVEAIQGDPLAFLFCAVIAGWFCIALLVLLVHKGFGWRGGALVALTPNALATLGVLGTFTGILVGLLDFDVENIDASVPELLAGLNIAFTTSIVGIASAILFRLVRVFIPGGKPAGGATPDDIHAVLDGIREDSRDAATRAEEHLIELRKAIASDGDGSLITQVQKLRTMIQDGQSRSAEEFDFFAGHATEDTAVLLDLREDGRAIGTRVENQLSELRKAIASDGDGSLITQIQKLRTTVQDGQSELIREFRSFAEHMTENSQKAIIEALENVIRDFNANLTEQFGENFKELNTAVTSLVTWQENYRNHVESLDKRLEAAVSAVEATQKALEQVQAHSERIPEAIRPLEPVLTGLNAQTQVLGAHLEAVAGLRDKAIEAFPVIEANLEKVTAQLSVSVEQAVEKSRAALVDGERAQAVLREGFDTFLADATNSRERFSAELSTALSEMSKQSTQEFERHGKLIEDSASASALTIGQAWDDSRKQMEAQFGEFDTQMQQELTRTLEVLGRNLASISEKFVTDYTPLTERLRDLVNVGRRVD